MFLRIHLPKLTAQQGDLGDMPRIGKCSDSKAFAMSARRVLGVEEEPEGCGALIVAALDMIRGAIGRGALAVEQRRVLVGAWFVAHGASNACRAAEIG